MNRKPVESRRELIAQERGAAIAELDRIAAAAERLEGALSGLRRRAPLRDRTHAARPRPRAGREPARVLVVTPAVKRRDPFAGASIEKKVAALALAAKPVLSRYYRDDCCVAATLAAIAVLERWRVKARPLYCNFQAYNAHWLAGERVLPAWAVGIDTHDVSGKPGLLGHLVAQGKDGSQKFLLDLSAYQFDRPERGIHVPSGIATAMLAPARGDVLAIAELRGGGGLVYARHPRPDDDSWKRAPDYLMPSEERRQAHERAVEDLVDEAARLVGRMGR